MKFVVFSLLACFLTVGTCKAENKSVEVKSTADRQKTYEKTVEMVTSGHAFIRELVCPDGSAPRFDSAGLGRKPDGSKVDYYTVVCKDGTRGDFEWAQGQASLPPPPKGFRMRSK